MLRNRQILKSSLRARYAAPLSCRVTRPTLPKTPRTWQEVSVRAPAFKRDLCWKTFTVLLFWAYEFPLTNSFIMQFFSAISLILLAYYFYAGNAPFGNELKAPAPMQKPTKSNVQQVASISPHGHRQRTNSMSMQ